MSKMSNVKTLKEAGFNRDAVIKSMADNFEYSESKHPQIGIFWYDSDKDDLFEVNKADAEHFDFVECSDNEQVRIYPRFHKDIWKRKQLQGKDKRFTGNHTSYPIGRVSQYKNRGFVVFVDDWIDKFSSVKQDIIYKFELPNDVEFVKDKHYIFY